MGSCTTFSKVFIFLVNFLFWLIAGVLLCICTFSVLQYFSTKCEFANFYLLIPLGILGVVGVLLFLNSFIGCCGAVRESKCCLSIFFTLTFCILCLEVSAAVLTFIFQQTITDTITNDWKGTIETYAPNSECSEIMDRIQSNLTCCGCDSYLDWSDDSTVWSSSHKDELPWSCCAEEEQKTSDNFTFCPMPSDSSTDSPIPKHLQGCCSQVKDFTEDNVIIFAAAALSIALLQGFVILMACGLMCRRKEQLYIHLDADMSQPSTPSISNL
ncbi:CD63 antigen-like [Symsagittifera roscoffensis]|uniref:CD63 antigen-like n=1 Tax=Symsagittifera roscoffensis TaxID=84072 RepID=UPI00307B9B3A